MKMMPLLTRIILPAILVCVFSIAHGQSKFDSLFLHKDSTAVMDSLLRDFHKYMDSMAKPRSFFTVSVGIGTGYFSYENKSDFRFNTARKPLLSPSVGYYHRSGFGIMGSAFIVLGGASTQLYQYAVSPSYDYVRSRTVSAGISFTKYFDKDSLPFYTTPIQQELFSYFTVKKWKLRPSIAVSYGWGSKKEYEKKQVLLWNRWLQQSQRGFITIENEESVHDLAAILSLKYNFMWYDLLTKDDGLMFTPVIMFTGGTQRFGFNTSYQSPSTVIRNNFLPSNQQITEQTGFGAQSLTFILRADYSLGKFFIMPQFLMDYYLPQAEDRFSAAYSVVAGFNF